MSHWILDVLVHRPDLPLYDNTAKVGLGLWNFPAVAFGLEALLLLGGIDICVRTGHVKPLAAAILGILMLCIQAYLFFGPPPVSSSAAAVTALMAYASFAIAIFFIERHSTNPGA